MEITQHLTEVRPTDEQLADFERLIQGSLPEDYKLFLKKVNGGRPRPNVFRFKMRDGTDEESVLHYFYALHEERVGSIERTFGYLKGRIPSDYLSIATDSFGNMILLRIAARGLGKIYFWDHEEEQDPPSLMNMSPIADSFTAFVQGLEPE